MDTFFKSWFTFGKNDGIIGASELPSDIEDDLGNRKNTHVRPDVEIPSTWTIQNENDFEKEFHKMIEGFDNLLHGFLNGSSSIEYKFGNLNEAPGENESNNESTKSLRERMLGENKEDVGNLLNQAPNDSMENRMGFFDPNSMFRGFFNFPFRCEENPTFRFGENPTFRFEETPAPQEDLDLDEDIKSGKKSLADILEKDNTENNARNDTFFHPFLWDGLNDSEEDKRVRGGFKFSSITKKYNPDGSVEIRSLKKDSDGNEESTVTRTLGDQSHTVVNKTNKDGENDIKENFINMDEGDKGAFEKDWNEKGKRSSDLLVPKDESHSFSDIFSSWFKPKL